MPRIGPPLARSLSASPVLGCPEGSRASGESASSSGSGCSGCIASGGRRRRPACRGRRWPSNSGPLPSTSGGGARACAPVRTTSSPFRPWPAGCTSNTCCPQRVSGGAHRRLSQSWRDGVDGVHGRWTVAPLASRDRRSLAGADEARATRLGRPQSDGGAPDSSLQAPLKTNAPQKDGALYGGDSFGASDDCCRARSARSGVCVDA